jgi:hypothetical protein
MKYIVQRHVMFYPSKSTVTHEKLLQFFTELAILEFVKFGYLKEI